MAIEMKDTGIKTDIWQINNSNIWYDDEGVGWDIDYVARFESFRANLQGTLICAWDAAYEKARALWTGSAECWPAAMVRCSDASDLEASLAFAQRYDLLLSIRDGEQPLAKPAVNSGALVIDTSLL